MQQTAFIFVMKCPGVGVGVEYSMTTHPKHLMEKITIMHLIYATYVMCTVHFATFLALISCCTGHRWCSYPSA